MKSGVVVIYTPGWLKRHDFIPFNKCSHQLLHARSSHFSCGVIKLLTLKFALF